MPRNPTRVLHDIACRSCNIVFRDHNRNRAYCSNLCRLNFMEARLFRCSTCGTYEEIASFSAKHPHLPRRYDLLQRKFIAEHQQCRRGMVDQLVDRAKCRCKTCRAEAGLPPERPFKTPKKRPARTHAYRRHAPEVFARDGYTCQICGLPTEPNAHPSDDTYPSLDHEVPLSEGGTDDVENLRTAHRWCNVKRNGTELWGALDDDAIRHLARERFTHLATP